MTAMRNRRHDGERVVVRDDSRKSDGRSIACLRSDTGVRDRLRHVMG